MPLAPFHSPNDYFAAAWQRALPQATAAAEEAEEEAEDEPWRSREQASSDEEGIEEEN